MAADVCDSDANGIAQACYTVGTAADACEAAKPPKSGMTAGGGGVAVLVRQMALDQPASQLNNIPDGVC